MKNKYFIFFLWLSAFSASSNARWLDDKSMPDIPNTQQLGVLQDSLVTSYVEESEHVSAHGELSILLQRSDETACFKQNLNLFCNDIRVVVSLTPKHCQWLCQQESACKFFTWNIIEGGVCWLKTADTGGGYEPGLVSGPAQCSGSDYSSGMIILQEEEFDELGQYEEIEDEEAGLINEECFFKLDINPANDSLKSAEHITGWSQDSAEPITGWSQESADRNSPHHHSLNFYQRILGSIQ